MSRIRAVLLSGVWALLVFVAVFGVVLNVPLVSGSHLLSSALSSSAASASLSADPSPGYYETSEYLIGSVAVGVVLPESNGGIDPSTEDWTESEESLVIAKITEALNWWTGCNPSAHVTFSTEVKYRVPTSYEPISRSLWDHGLWINETIEYLGYPSVLDCVNDLRNRLGTNWALLIFVVDSSNDADGRWTDGTYAHGPIGGPYMVMTYDGPYKGGITIMPFMTAHELGHNFYATDEYNGAREYSGYLNISDNDFTTCLMWNDVWKLCNASREQIGWRDTDLDGILDIVNTFPETTLNPHLPNPTTNNILTYTGSVAEVPYRNRNPYTYTWPEHQMTFFPIPRTQRNITINTIEYVEYRVDNEPWKNATAIDGTFDEAEEDFTFTTPWLPDGLHTIEVRATNSVGNIETTRVSTCPGIELKYQTPYSLEKGWVYVLAETSVFDGIESSLHQYAIDLESIDGFSVGIYAVSTSNTTAIRSFLQQALPEGLVGCLLVGNIPEAYYEWVDWEYASYYVPTDIYYMDLDGVWNDTDNDGAYDKHTGQVGAEIWIGTLQPNRVGGDGVQLLNNYFRKNNLYRTGKLALPKRALAYIDDNIGDLSAWEKWVNDTTKMVYNETVVVADPEITVASDYLERLQEGYEWIYLVTHGWPGSHTFWHQGSWDGTVYGSDYREIDPPTFFYVLRACYTASGYDNVAGSCVFTDTYGLLAFGSRGTAWKPGPGIVGHPWDYQLSGFYTVLSEGKCIGEAYKEDMKFYESMIIADPEYEIPGFEYMWGITGDPSLHIHGYPDVTPPVIALLSPKNVTYTTNSVPLNFRIDETTSWIGYCLDRQANVTIAGNTTLFGLLDGSHSLILYYNDTAGNTKASETVYFTVDTIPPTTSHDYDGLWHTIDFTIALTATDVSGVAETYYKINNGLTKIVSVNGQPHITTEGTNNKLEYWSLDNAGNEEITHEILTEIKLDKTAPTANAGEDQIVNEDTSSTLNASASTDENGIATYTWAFTDVAPQALTGKNPTYTFSTPGTYIITLTVADPAGNTATDTLTVTVRSAEDFPMWTIGVAIAAIAIVVTATLLLRKRK